MKAEIAPVVARSKDGHLDMLDRKRAERDGEFILKEFDGVILKRWPTGRLEVTLPDGEYEADINKRSYAEVQNAISHCPQLRTALLWAGWTFG